jgi:hypothetical protein
LYSAAYNRRLNVIKLLLNIDDVIKDKLDVERSLWWSDHMLKNHNAVDNEKFNYGSQADYNEIIRLLTNSLEAVAGGVAARSN